MKTSPRSLRPSASRTRFLLLALLGLASPLLAQDAAPDDRGRRRGGGQDNGGNGQDRRNFSPEAMQERMLAGIRERMGVTNDEEWGLISQRLTKVMELRRTSGGGMGGMGGMMFGGRGGPGGPGGPGGQGGQGGADPRGGRSGRSANPESEALQTAITDKLPDAEIKARLERVRDVRKASEARLAQAQEELRAVLTVRQEAMAVMVGLLP